MPLLELRNVSKGYGKGSARAEVLRNLSLSVEDGEFVAIVGYSGAGKTTLISLLAGLIRPDAGEVIAFDRPVTAPSPERGLVFQNYSLLPWLSVLDNVLLAVQQVFGSEPSAAQRRRALDAIAQVKLTPAIDKKPSELSGGMRQRVSVARALAMNPRVLLLDEPLSALDALTRATVQDEIVQLWQREQKTVVLITNDVDEGLLMADRIIPLSAGPGASLGPSFKVDIERPRDRKALNHDPRFRAIRTQVIEWLIGPGKQNRVPRQKAKAPTAMASKPRSGVEVQDVTIGFVPVTDAAPFIIASERGLFRKHGLRVRLRRMTGWMPAMDGLSNGSVRATHLPISLAVASAVGLLGQHRPAFVFPFVVSRNGQAISLGRRYESQVTVDAHALKPLIDAANSEDRTPTFAVPHPLSTHALWLRYWLGSGGIHPDVDVNLTTMPPQTMVASLRSGAIDGMCVGEPWPAVAISDGGVAFTAMTSQEIWHDHPEKVCAFNEAFANSNPNTVKAMCKALHEAGAWLDEPANREEAARIMAPPHYVNCPAATIAGRLLGRYEFGDGRRKDFGDLGITFNRRNANYPQRKFVLWMLSQFRRWGMLESAPDYEAVCRRVARFDLYEQAMNEVGYRHFGEDRMPEILFDGQVFDAGDPEGYARSFRINTMGESATTANVIGGVR